VISKLVDPRAVASWPLAESAESVLPQDVSGHLADLTVPSGLTRPAVVEGTPTGFGRAFTRSPATGLLVEDTADDLLLPREVTLLWLGSLDVASLSDGDLCTLVQRGRGGGSDPITFGLRVAVVTASTRSVRLEMYWQTEAGADVVDAGAVFTWPADAFVFLAGVREAISGQLAVRYQINGDAIDGEQDHDLDCGGATSADVSIGMGMDGVTYQDHWEGSLDAGQLIAEAVTPEEFRWVWERMTIDQPAGVDMMRALVPPGDVYSTDPESQIQRELKAEGLLFGYAKSLARRLRFYLLPDVAWGVLLEQWEHVTGHSPGAGDDVQTRRDRIVTFLGAHLGFSIADVKTQLELLFGLDAADIEILEYDNDVAVDFSAEPLNHLQIDGDVTWTVGSGVLNATAATTDLRYPTGAGLYLFSLAEGDGATVKGKISLTGGSDAPAYPGQRSTAALVLGRRDTDEWVFVGVSDLEDGPDLVWFVYAGGVLGAAVVLAAGVDPTTVVRVRVLSDATMEVQWGDDEAAAIAATPETIAPAIGIPMWAGFAAVAPAVNASDDLEADFDDLLLHTPNSHQRVNWWAYRDPGLGGTYDLEGARLLVARIKPEHTIGGATTTRAVLCDDPENGCDNAPLGDAP